MHRVASVGVLWALCCATTAADAQDVPVSFEAAVALAARNPRVLQGHRGSALLRRAAETSPPVDANPQITVTGGARVTPAGEQGFEGSVGVSQSFSVQGVAGLRRAALSDESRWMGAEADAETLTRRLAAANAWLALREAEEQLSLAESAIANEARFVDLVTRLAAGGERTAGDVAAASVGLEEARMRGRLAEGAIADARWAAAAEIGTPERGALVTEGPAPELPAPSERERQLAFEGVASLPSVRSRRLLARVEATRALEERATRGTRLTLGVEARRDALTAGVVQATVAVPLPFFAVGDREFAARRAAALRMEGEADAEAVRAAAELRLAAHDVEHSTEVYDALVANLLPASERAVALRERQLTVGEGTILDVLDARRSLVDARIRWVRAAHDRTSARLRWSVLAQAARRGE